MGRPAPLDELDAHLDRIAGWGMNCLRLLTTWEAIEHAGPGEYDDAYLDYYAEVVRRAGARGLWVFVDPHQDVWSRWTGGDGAPFWCFELAGLVPERFVAAEAVALDTQDWPENYQRAPVATMWTLFYGGDTFCPELSGVQQELQDRYIGAVAALAERVADLDNVLGYDPLNEPGNGYIGRSARSMTTGWRIFEQDGPAPWSPLEYLAAAAGVPVRREGGEVLNPTASPSGATVAPGNEAGRVGPGRRRPASRWPTRCASPSATASASTPSPISTSPSSVASASACGRCILTACCSSRAHRGTGTCPGTIPIRSSSTPGTGTTSSPWGRARCRRVSTVGLTDVAGLTEVYVGELGALQQSNEEKIGRVCRC